MITAHSPIGVLRTRILSVPLCALWSLLLSAGLLSTHGSPAEGHSATAVNAASVTTATFSGTPDPGIRTLASEQCAPDQVEHEAVRQDTCPDRQVTPTPLAQAQAAVAADSTPGRRAGHPPTAATHILRV